jgi:hypothetical protein
VTTQRCTQCWHFKPAEDFIGKKGLVRKCTDCRQKYDAWGKLTLAERQERRNSRATLVPGPELRVIFQPRSNNKKLGKMPSTISSAETCPPSCGFFGKGCYAEFSFLRSHWARTPKDGLPWAAFLDRVRELPEGQLWRHNEAGDLPGAGETLSTLKLAELVAANWGRRGFTFTHKPLTLPTERLAVQCANRAGFTVNLSADSLAHADERAELGIAPVAVVLPANSPTRGLRTPAGRPIAVCPAQTRKTTCAECQLCTRAGRTGIVGFLAHGQSKAQVSLTVLQEMNA